MNKKYMFGLFALLAIGLVGATGYLVSSFVITTDVYEPFQVEYAIMGDAGNYVSGDCDEVASEDWMAMSESPIDVGGLYAGESRKICTKIVNLGEGDISYTFSGEATDGGAICATNFGTMSVEGVALGKQTSYNGAIVNVEDAAAPVDNCEITLSVTRG